MTIEEIEKLKKGDLIFHTRFLPSCGISEINELNFMRYNGKSVSSCNRKTKQITLVGTNDFKNLYTSRNEALFALKEIEKNCNYKKKQFTIQLEDEEGEEQ